jgi:hypothetical protein
VEQRNQDGTHGVPSLIPWRKSSRITRRVGFSPGTGGAREGAASLLLLRRITTKQNSHV